MHKHFLKISWRNLLRNKVFSSIKIGGFAIGISACILISLFIKHELSYDKNYGQSDRIFRIANNYEDAQETDLWTNLQGPLKSVLEDNLPEIEKVSRTVFWKWGNVGENHIRTIESKNNIYEGGFFYSDPELLDILEIPMVYGMHENALSRPNTMVISRSKAEKYFPNENPVGQLMVLNDNPNTTYTIGGVMEDFTPTSHLQGDFILTLAERQTGPGTSGWCCSNYSFYVKLIPGADKLETEKKMVTIRDTYVIEKLREAGNSDLEDLQKYQSYYMQPVSNIHLNPEEVSDFQTHGSIEILWVFGAVAGIILLLACLNFINLSTAKSIKRAKEAGLRKVVGSYRSSLIYQYLSESTFYSLLSVLIGAVIAWIALPYFNQIAGKNLTIPWLSWWFIPTLLIVSIAIGIFSGLYPAFYLSRFSPIEALKGKFSGVKASMLRSSMVVFQFTATVILIIGALTTHRQFQHYMNKSIGFEKEQVINILGINTLEEQERLILKNELLKLASVENATLGDYLPVSGSSMTNFGFWIDGRRQIDVGFEAARWIVDEDYINTLNMEIVAGRNFNKSTSDGHGIIINESMAKAFGIDEPVDTNVIDMFDGKYKVIGVVKDFYFESLTGQVRPLAMVRGKGKSTLSLKIQSEDMAEVLSGITAVWDSFSPNQPIRYSFLDQRFEQMYKGLLQTKTIFLIFSTLSIIVACLGLFALSAYTIEQRSKEISVRKVLGASVSKIFALLAADFIKLILIAVVIAIPIGWYLMDGLLADMANRINLSWPVFALSAVVALLIAVVTISFESIKAALVNPSNKLRSE